MSKIVYFVVSLIDGSILGLVNDISGLVRTGNGEAFSSIKPSPKSTFG